MMRIPRRALLAAGALAGLGALLVLGLLLSRGEPRAILASGTVEAAEADLGFQVPGRVDSIAVDEGDRVRAGQVLAWLDRSELAARRRAAEAQLQAARARLAELVTGFREQEIAQAEAALRAAERRLEDARRDLERTRRLFEGGAVSRQALDNQETVLTLAEADAARARERLSLLQTGARAEQIAAQRALVAQAEAALQQLDATLEHTAIRAPFDGIVTVRHREPGETVQAGAPVVTVMSPGDRWVRIYVREDLVGRVAIGMPAVITQDAFPDTEYSGEVVFIASEAEFTPRNVQTTEERVKLVYRVKVRIVNDTALELKPGLPADVRLPVEPR